MMRIILLSLFCFFSACGGDSQVHAEAESKESTESPSNATVVAPSDVKQAMEAEKKVSPNPNTQAAQSSKSGESVLRFREGVDYIVRPNEALSPELKLVEYFSYSCPHCFHAEPSVKAYLAQKPDNVEVVKIPVGFFKPMFELTRLAAIVAEVLGKREALHEKMFLAIHGPDGKHFRNDRELVAFFEANGVTEAEYKKALESEAANQLHFQYRKAVNESGISGVPTFYIRNKYQVAHRSDRSKEDFVALINYLMAKKD